MACVTSLRNALAKQVTDVAYLNPVAVHCLVSLSHLRYAAYGRKNELLEALFSVRSVHR
jgi:hypothetical protein